MSDLFHQDVPDAYVRMVFEVMAVADWHVYQVLTKRAERLRKLTHRLPEHLAGAHVWLGVSVEDRRYGLPRIDELRAARANVRFLSIEPLLEDLGALDLADIDWVIVGGESGPGARPMREDWVLAIRDQCSTAGVPFFFKQWGGVRKKHTGRMLKGKTYDELPVVAEVKPPSAEERQRRTSVIVHQVSRLAS
jgi:protein gp37